MAPIRSASDSAVRLVAQAVWYHHDDCRDHLVRLSSAEWRLLQRYLLLLQFHAVWFVFSPVALLFQALPAMENRTHVTAGLRQSAGQ